MDTTKKQRKQIDSLLAERKSWLDRGTEMEQLRKQLKEETQRHDNAKKVIRDQAEKVKQVMEDISQKVAQYSLSQSELANLRSDHASLQRLLREVTTSRDAERQASQALDKELEDVKEKSNALIQQLDELRVKPDKLEAELSKTQNRLRHRGEEMERLHRSFAEAKRDLGELRAKLEHRERADKLGSADKMEPPKTGT